MEGTVSTTVVATTGKNGNQEVDQETWMSNKPLHRFVQREPRIVGIAVVIFGCAELLMGFNLRVEGTTTSCDIYVPFWQGALFVISGSLTIYTETHPSKKMVTVSLAMYIVSILGIFVSVGYRIYCFIFFALGGFWRWRDDWHTRRLEQLSVIEGVLFTSSLFQFGLLVFLCVIARLALKSTHTQIIVQHISSPARATTLN